MTTDSVPGRTPYELTPDNPDVLALGPAGRALVLDIVSELDEDDLVLAAGESRVLLEAARTLDLAERIAAELANSDLTVVGSTGQPRSNPLIDSLDKSRRTLAVLLAQVAKADRAEAARAAARAAARGHVGSLPLTG